MEMRGRSYFRCPRVASVSRVSYDGHGFSRAVKNDTERLGRVRNIPTQAKRRLGGHPAFVASAENSVSFLLNLPQASWDARDDKEESERLLDRTGA
jgi:hypothetical protein